jgi:hypothetical protein
VHAGYVLVYVDHDYASCFLWKTVTQVEIMTDETLSTGEALDDTDDVPELEDMDDIGELRRNVVHYYCVDYHGDNIM